MVNPKATEYQIEVAAQLGLDVASDTIAVAAAKIGDVVSSALDEATTVRSSTELQNACGRALGIDVSHDTPRVASARIADAQRLKNFEALAKLHLRPGDTVATRHKVVKGGRIERRGLAWVISWIRRDGRVFFKDAHGRGAWPDHLVKLSSGHGS